MSKIDLGTYVYYINHNDATIERYKIVSEFIRNESPVYMLVNEHTTLVVDYWDVVDEFMTPEKIYMYVLSQVWECAA